MDGRVLFIRVMDMILVERFPTFNSNSRAKRPERRLVSLEFGDCLLFTRVNDHGVPWDESFTFPCTAQSEETLQNLKLTLWTTNSTKNDFMDSASLTLKGIRGLKRAIQKNFTMEPRNIAHRISLRLFISIGELFYLSPHSIRSCNDSNHHELEEKSATSTLGPINQAQNSEPSADNPYSGLGHVLVTNPELSITLLRVSKNLQNLILTEALVVVFSVHRRLEELGKLMINEEVFKKGLSFDDLFERANGPLSILIRSMGRIHAQSYVSKLVKNFLSKIEESEIQHSTLICLKTVPSLKAAYGYLMNQLPTSVNEIPYSCIQLFNDTFVAIRERFHYSEVMNEQKYRYYTRILASVLIRNMIIPAFEDPYFTGNQHGSLTINQIKCLQWCAQALTTTIHSDKVPILIMNQTLRNSSQDRTIRRCVRDDEIINLVSGYKLQIDKFSAALFRGSLLYYQNQEQNECAGCKSMEPKAEEVLFRAISANKADLHNLLSANRQMFTKLVGVINQMAPHSETGVHGTRLKATPSENMSAVAQKLERFLQTRISKRELFEKNIIRRISHRRHIRLHLNRWLPVRRNITDLLEQGIYKEADLPETGLYQTSTGSHKASNLLSINRNKNVLLSRIPSRRRATSKVSSGVRSTHQANGSQFGPFVVKIIDDSDDDEVIPKGICRNMTTKQMELSANFRKMDSSRFQKFLTEAKVERTSSDPNPELGNQLSALTTTSTYDTKWKFLYKAKTKLSSRNISAKTLKPVFVGSHVYCGGGIPKTLRDQKSFNTDLERASYGPMTSSKPGADIVVGSKTTVGSLMKL